MKENDLIDLGFERQDEQSDPQDIYHYYTMDFAQGFSMISCASDEVDCSDNWYVDVFNTDVPVRFHDVQELVQFIGLAVSAMKDVVHTFVLGYARVKSVHGSPAFKVMQTDGRRVMLDIPEPYNKIFESKFDVDDLILF